MGREDLPAVALLLRPIKEEGTTERRDNVEKVKHKRSACSSVIEHTPLTVSLSSCQDMLYTYYKPE